MTDREARRRETDRVLDLARIRLAARGVGDGVGCTPRPAELSCTVPADCLSDRAHDVWCHGQEVVGVLLAVGLNHLLELEPDELERLILEATIQTLRRLVSAARADDPRRAQLAEKLRTAMAQYADRWPGREV